MASVVGRAVRTVALLGLVLAALIALGVSAEAHALVRSSNPPGSASLDRAPSQVSITFTERPDAQLSSIHVLDRAGASVERGPARPLPGDPLTLVVPLPSLTDGTYTVTWRTVSAVDGHVAAGSFAFGVGVPASAPSQPATSATTPPPTPLGVAGRWLLYAGFAFLLGGSWLSILGLASEHRRLFYLSGGGFMLCIVGLALISQAEVASAGVDWSTFFATSLGSTVERQLTPVILAGLGLASAWLLRDRARQAAFAVVAVITGFAILAHILASHAASSRLSPLMVAAQWGHVAAFATWIGGLAALLVAVRGAPAEWKVEAVRRLSFVAGIALALIGITGLLRAIDEVGSLSSLTGTLFGRLVLVKVGLFVILALLGAVNRYRNVPLIRQRLPALQLVGMTEVGVAAIVLVVAATLTSLPPPSYSQASAVANAPSNLVVTGADYGTTVRLRLEITPGFPGSNRFALTVHDYDSGAPVSVNAARLRFDFSGQAAAGESTLDLKENGPGTYVAAGSNLSLAGRWSVTALLERGVNSVEVPLDVTTAAPRERIQESSAAGQPTIYTIALAGGRSVQTYVDPGTPGLNQVHATFFNTQGNELPVRDGAVISGTPAGSGPTTTLAMTRLSAGHFVGQGNLQAGRWRFDVAATAGDAPGYYVSFTVTIR